MPTYLPWLDLLRFVACVLVILSHLNPFPQNPEANHFGHNGVGLFFSISGYLIGSVLMNGREKAAWVGRFYANRLLRIYPALLAALAIYGAVLLTGRGRPGLWGMWPEFRDNLPYYLTFTSFFSPNDGTPYGIVWTLCVEEYFYLFLPLLFWALGPRGTAVVLAGVIAALVGLVFGIPSLRIKGFYLAVATLAAQFFLIWLFNKVAWFTNYASSGTITAPPRTIAGVMVTGPLATAGARYVAALALVALGALVAKNLVRGRIGRSWMAMRDRDIAAEIIGIRPLRTKLLAFGISSFYCGVAGAEYVFLYLGSAETLAFDIALSFLVLFMVIIGGLGSILGSFLGAAFIVLVPIFLTNAPHLLHLPMPVALQKQIELMVFGGLIIFFLIVEPRGLARLWQIAKEKLRLWPFPH